VAKDLFDAVYGCLIGGAVGDALGAPTEGMYYQEIQQKFGRLETLLPNQTSYTNGKPGSMTDDSVLRHYLCYAIAEKGQRVFPEDFARIIREKMNPDRLWISERIVKERLQAGINPWEAGRGAIPAGCGPMYIAPVGIINAGDPEQAYEDGYALASVNQDGENRDFAASFAAASAAAFLPGATIQTLIETVQRYSVDIVKRAFELSFDIAYASAGVQEFKERFYEKMLDWTWSLPPGRWDKTHFFSGNSREFVPVIFCIIQLMKEDINESIIEGANFGRDCDTIASMIGNLLGAMKGASSIRKEWIETVEAANSDLFEELEGDANKNLKYMSERLVKAMRSERVLKANRLAMYDQIIGK